MNCGRCNHLNPDDALHCSRCGERLQGAVPEADAAGGLAPGAALGDGRYVVERLLGEGGMGAVYMATDVRLGRTVAIKLLHPELTAHPTARPSAECQLPRAASARHVALVALAKPRIAGSRQSRTLAPFPLPLQFPSPSPSPWPSTTTARFPDIARHLGSQARRFAPVHGQALGDGDGIANDFVRRAAPHGGP